MGRKDRSLLRHSTASGLMSNPSSVLSQLPQVQIIHPDINIRIQRLHWQHNTRIGKERMLRIYNKA